MSHLTPEQRIEILSLASRYQMNEGAIIDVAQTYERFVTGNVPPAPPPVLVADGACEKAVQPEVIYEVVPVVRFVARRVDLMGNNAPAEYIDSAEYDSEEMALAVATALAKGEQQHRGFGPGDERLRFPTPINFARLLQKVSEERSNG